MQVRSVTPTIIAALAAASLFACGPIQTHNTVVFEQPKPLEVNVNLSGKLELVITDARQDLEKITGEKAVREVKPEDIGLPPDDATTAPTSAPSSLLPAPIDTPIALLTSLPPAAHPPARFIAAASEDQLVASMAARNDQVHKLLLAQVAGEAHTGLLVPKGTLSAAQSAVLTAENNDRTALYTLRAAKNHTTAEQAALAYYLLRLGYVQKGDWVEIFNKQSKAWEWKQWDR